jgi:hypothetical protein
LNLFLKGVLSRFRKYLESPNSPKHGLSGNLSSPWLVPFNLMKKIRWIAAQAVFQILSGKQQTIFCT